ncbi:YbaK/EbsC family protein [Halalkalicoccus ordinarius]|uniref:YbaK/EbsC family protein n=1 Tax=Halalkalicoccus ordinarius TaxID=3116651 RepID=UPI00300F586B
MHPRAAEFRERAAERYGLEIEVHEFDEGTKTAADAADAVGCDVAQIASSIVMVADGTATAVSGSEDDPDESELESSDDASPKRAGGDADGEPVVVVTSGANRVDETRVAAELGVEEVRMADADAIRETLGWSIGGVPPICHETDVPVLFDETLTGFETVWAAAGTPDAVFPIDPTSLVELADATPCSVADQ